MLSLADSIRLCKSPPIGSIVSGLSMGNSRLAGNIRRDGCPPAEISGISSLVEEARGLASALSVFVFVEALIYAVCKEVHGSEMDPKFCANLRVL